MSTNRKYCKEIVFNNNVNSSPNCNKTTTCEPVVTTYKELCNCTCKKCNSNKIIKKNNKKACCKKINSCNKCCNSNKNGFGLATLLLLAFFL